jgi:hypothetical protein
LLALCSQAKKELEDVDVTVVTGGYDGAVKVWKVTLLAPEGLAYKTQVCCTSIY